MTGVLLMLAVRLMMFVTEWRMALAGIAAAIVGFMLTVVIMGASQKFFVARQSQLGALNGHIEETFGGQIVVRVYNGELPKLRPSSRPATRLCTRVRGGRTSSGPAS